MKKIWYINPNRLPTEEAHGYQIMKMGEAFTRNGWQVNLVVPQRKNPITEDAFAYYGLEKSFNIFYLPVVDWHSYRIFKNLFLSRIAHFLVLATFLKAAGRLAREKIDPEKDIIYTRSHWLACFFRKYPNLIYEIHTISRLLYFYKTPWLAPRLLVTITQQLKNILVSQGLPAEKILVAPDAVDLAKFNNLPDKEQCRRKLGLPLARPIVGYIGRFLVNVNQEKGISNLIKAVAALGEIGQQQPVLLAVGGPAQAIPAYRELALKEGLSPDQIIFHDRVPNNEVPFWIRACDVVTIPWPWTEFSAYYTSPLKLFEYMAAGVPIVASDLPALREIISEKSAVLVRPGEPRALAVGIERVLKNPEFTATIALEAKKDVKQYTWQKRVEKIIYG